MLADTPSRVDPGNLISWPPPHPPPPPNFLEQRPAPFPPALPSTSRAGLLLTPARQPTLHPREAAASARPLPGSPRPGPSIVRAPRPAPQAARHHEVQRPCGEAAQSPGEEGQQPGHQQGRSALDWAEVGVEVWAVGEGARTPARASSQFQLPQPSPLVLYPLVTLSVWSGQGCDMSSRSLGESKSSSAPLSSSLP